jgi:hypothetical protein
MMKSKLTRNRTGAYRCEVRGSYTVEVAILMPLILFIIMAFISIGIEEYQVVLASIAESEKMKPQGAAEKVRLLLFCENVLEELEWK